MAFVMIGMMRNIVGIIAHHGRKIRIIVGNVR